MPLSGNPKKGTVDAETPRSARAKLRRDKIIISKLEEASAPSKNNSLRCSHGALVCLTWR